MENDNFMNSYDLFNYDYDLFHDNNEKIDFYNKFIKSSKTYHSYCINQGFYLIEKAKNILKKFDDYANMYDDDEIKGLICIDIIEEYWMFYGDLETILNKIYNTHMNDIFDNDYLNKLKAMDTEINECCNFVTNGILNYRLDSIIAKQTPNTPADLVKNIYRFINKEYQR